MVWRILEPDALQDKPLDGLLIGRTLVDLNAKEGKETCNYPCKEDRYCSEERCLLNLSDRPKRIKQGTTVVICVVVDDWGCTTGINFVLHQVCFVFFKISRTFKEYSYSSFKCGGNSGCGATPAVLGEIHK